MAISPDSQSHLLPNVNSSELQMAPQLLVDQKLESARQDTSLKAKGLIHHADFWYNLDGHSVMHPQPTEAVRWQILHAASSFRTTDGGVNTGFNFGYKHLSPEELVSLYRILNSYRIKEAAENADAPLFYKHVSYLESHLMRLCATNLTARSEVNNILKQLDDDSLAILKKKLDPFLNYGIHINPGTIAKVEAAMADILSREPTKELNFYKSQLEHRVFTLASVPGLIFKMGPEEENSEIELRCQNAEFAKTVCRTHNLGLLVIPDFEKFYVEHLGKKYACVAEKKLDFDIDESHQEEFYSSEPASLNETIRQLTTFICLTGYSDVEFRNIPVLKNSVDSLGQRKVAILDMEDQHSAEWGLFGSGAPYFARGLINCVQESQFDIIINEAKKHLNWTKDHDLLAKQAMGKRKSEFLYKSSVSSSKLIMQKLDAVRRKPQEFHNSPLIAHADAWYNLKGDKGFKLKPSEAVKWQILHAASPFKNTYEALLPHPDFHVAHLSPQDLSLLYRILISYLESDLLKENQPLVNLTKHYLKLIENHIFANFKEKNKAYDLIACLKEHQDSRLNDLCTRLDEFSSKYALLDVKNKAKSMQLAIAYLDNFYANIEKYESAEMENKFYFFVKALDALYPEMEIHRYIFDFGFSNIANAPDFDALKILLSHFNAKNKDSEKYKGKINNVETVNLSDFAAKLTELNRSDFKGEIKFLVLHRGSVGGHYIPVFLKKTDAGTTMIITDSGPFAKSKYLPGLKTIINSSELKTSKLIAFEPARQADGVSCSITSFRDVLESFKFNLFEFVDTVDPSEVEEKEGFSVIKHYPPNFMKVTQGVSYLDKYEQSKPDWKYTIVASKTVDSGGGQPVKKDKTLREVVESHTLTTPAKKVNFYLRKRAFKYFCLILRTLLQQQLAQV